VSHDQDEAIAVSDRILIMNQGSIEQDGTPEDVYERPVTRFVADFMGEANLLDGTRISERQVRTSIGELQVATTPAWERGTLAIRPEDIEVRHTPGLNHLSGTISERLFRGDHWELLVDIAGTQIRVSTEPDQQHHAGEAVFLELPSDDLLVLRD
jgi:spermidine/putrescine transport system ATP-binding protein